MLLYTFFELFKQYYHWVDEESNGEVADGVDYIKRKARDYPSDCLLKIKPEQNRLRRGVEDAEGKTVQHAKHGVDDTCDALWHFLWKQHS